MTVPPHPAQSRPVNYRISPQRRGRPWMGTAGASRIGGKMRRAWVLSSVCVGLLFGCAGVRVPKYEHPQAQTKANWARPAGSTMTAAEAISPQWWSQFGDPHLDALVTQAIGGNVDLKV